jgi:hypothetical protein
MADPRLAALYAATDYQVLAPEGRFSLQMGSHSEALARVFADEGTHCAAYITAWNPGSQRPTEAENADAQRRLIARLAGLQLRWLPGLAVDPKAEWPTEPSLLVFALDEDEAVELGVEFRQKALVYAGSDAIPRLLWLPTAPPVQRFPSPDFSQVEGASAQ